MTKAQEQQLIKQVTELQKRVADLYTQLDNNKLQKHVYTVAEVASILNISAQAVYKMIARGELETIKLGHIKVTGSSLREKLGIEV